MAWLPVTAAQPAESATGDEATRHGQREGQRAEAAKRSACSASPHPVSCQAFFPTGKPSPLQSERAPRDSDPPTCRPRPPAVAHVPRPALPRAPPPARVRLAGPAFLSRADPSPPTPCSGPSHSSERSIEFESSTDTHGRGAAR
jgi:hypothetical protein